MEMTLVYLLLPPRPSVLVYNAWLLKSILPWSESFLNLFFSVLSQFEIQVGLVGVGRLLMQAGEGAVSSLEVIMLRCDSTPPPPPPSPISHELTALLEIHPFRILFAWVDKVLAELCH